MKIRQAFCGCFEPGMHELTDGDSHVHQCMQQESTLLQSTQLAALEEDTGSGTIATSQIIPLLLDCKDLLLDKRKSTPCLFIRGVDTQAF